MIGRSTGETYRLGDHVTVKLVEAIPVAGALRFELLSEGRMEKPQRGKSKFSRGGDRAGPKSFGKKSFGKSLAGKKSAGSKAGSTPGSKSGSKRTSHKRRGST